MTAPRFAPGDRVVVDTRAADHHCRTPYYLRGQSGVVERVHGQYRDPEKLAYHRPGLPKRYLYRVRFEQAAIWPDYAAGGRDILAADIFEHWLLAER